MKRQHKPGEAIDWVRLRKRLARAIEATEGATRLSPERARAVMDERARALAHPAAVATADTAMLTVLAFSAGEERYGIEAHHVREVARLTDLTPLPGAPDFLAGVINLRGRILAVIDLRTFLGAGGSGAARIVVLGGDRAEFGVLAAADCEVHPLWPDEILEPPASLHGAARDFVRGVTAGGLVVLDGEALLRDPRLFVDQGDEAAG
jgi:purine-binding chemotaxis protein CheW